MTIWQPGMRCVCISRPIRQPQHGETMPSKGCVYTVREVDFSFSGQAYLRLEEISNPLIDYGLRVSEAAFFADLFRPLSETRLDQFRKLLAPQPREEVPA